MGERLSKRIHRPDLQRLMDESFAKQKLLTPEQLERQRQAQRESWVRGMTARCEHGELDFEQCPDCRSAERKENPHG